MVTSQQTNHQNISGIALVFSGLIALVLFLLLISSFSISFWQPHSEKVLDSYIIEPERFIKLSSIYFTAFLFSSLALFLSVNFLKNRAEKRKSIYHIIKIIGLKVLPFILSFLGVAFWVILKNNENSIVFIPSFMMLFTGLLFINLNKIKGDFLVGVLFLIISFYSFFSEEYMLLYLISTFGFLNMIYGVFLILDNKKTVEVKQK